jgi:hypothetical protein
VAAIDIQVDVKGFSLIPLKVTILIALWPVQQFSLPKLHVPSNGTNAIRLLYLIGIVRPVLAH